MKYRKQHFIDIQLFENIMQLQPIAIYHFLNYMNNYCDPVEPDIKPKNHPKP